jgi:hypothetical protein
VHAGTTSDPAHPCAPFRDPDRGDRERTERLPTPADPYDRLDELRRVAAKARRRVDLSIGTLRPAASGRRARLVVRHRARLPAVGRHAAFRAAVAGWLERRFG